MLQRFTVSLAVSAAVVVLMATMALAQRADGAKVTGGGQVDVAADGQGAGNTIIFVGHDIGDRGQVQYVETSSGGGAATGHWHGLVNCVSIDGNQARLSGSATDGETFWIEVIDNGTPAQGTDVVRLHKPTDSTCDEENDDAHTTELGRGNATVHNG